MIVWITSFPRSGNTFFRVVMHHIYGIDTYAAFRAGEVLNWAGAGDLVGHRPFPKALESALETGQSDQIREALDVLEARDELFVFKTHAWANELYGTNYRAILVARDGRDSLVSYVNYLMDVQFNATRLKSALRGITRSSGAWLRVIRILAIAAAKRLGLRRWMASAMLNRLLRVKEDSEWNWSTMNRSWLELKRKPVVVHFSDLTRDPISTVTDAVAKLGIGLVRSNGAPIPSFLELKKQYPSFFRKGTSGDWRNYFSSGQDQHFRSRHAETMRMLGLPLDRETSQPHKLLELPKVVGILSVAAVAGATWTISTMRPHALQTVGSIEIRGPMPCVQRTVDSKMPQSNLNSLHDFAAAFGKRWIRGESDIDGVDSLGWPMNSPGAYAFDAFLQTSGSFNGLERRRRLEIQGSFSYIVPLRLCR